MLCCWPSPRNMMCLECEVCLEVYDARKRVPRSLSCKHSLCTSCIAEIMRRGPLKCPFCRTLHAATIISPADVPVHGEMVALVSKEEAVTETEGPNVLKLRSDIESGVEVWAVLATDTGPRCAKVTMHNNRLHLHALMDGQPPHNATTVEYATVRALVEEALMVSFLDISWGRRCRGRVYIILLDKEGRTMQFKYLCSGERGPSYAQTKFIQVTLKDQPGQQLWGGDYENNDGTGGAALNGMERGTPNHQDVLAGLVAGYYYEGYGQDHSPAQFGIYTKDMPGYSEMSSIGRVVEGLDLVKSVTNFNNVQLASVSDCGLLLAH